MELGTLSLPHDLETRCAEAKAYPSPSNCFGTTLFVTRVTLFDTHHEADAFVPALRSNFSPTSTIHIGDVALFGHDPKLSRYFSKNPFVTFFEYFHPDPYYLDLYHAGVVVTLRPLVTIFSRNGANKPCDIRSIPELHEEYGTSSLLYLSSKK